MIGNDPPPEILATRLSKYGVTSGLAALSPQAQVIHLYAQPEDPGYLAAQQRFAGANPWFQVKKLQARSHFPMYEVPDQMAAAINRFVSSTIGAPGGLTAQGLAAG